MRWDTEAIRELSKSELSRIAQIANMSLNLLQLKSGFMTRPCCLDCSIPDGLPPRTPSTSSTPCTLAPLTSHLLRYCSTVSSVHARPHTMPLVPARSVITACYSTRLCTPRPILQAVVKSWRAHAGSTARMPRSTHVMPVQCLFTQTEPMQGLVTHASGAPGAWYRTWA